MSACVRCLPAVAVLLGLLLPGCAMQRAAVGEDRSGELVVTEEEVRASGATTAWEVMKRTIPRISFVDDARGNPRRMSVRGASSMYLSDRPNIFIDGVRVTEFMRLDQMPASSIATIRFLSGITGTTRYGTNSGDGVILIQTKNGAPGS